MTIYRPPSFSLVENNALKDFLIDFCEDKEVILQGNFDLPSIQWDKDDIIASSYVLPLDLDFFHAYVNLGLVQVGHESIFFSSGNIINLVL